jgi:CRP/FNR family cyclic AMP-dependent transcriptional regulator
MGIKETLKRAEVFLELDDSDLQKIASLPSCREVTYQAQETIFQAGDEANNLYVLEEGQVSLAMVIRPSSTQPVKQVTVDIITKGGFFGWSALVPPHSYVMSAICQQPSKVVIMSGAELSRLFDEDNHIGYTVLQSLTRIIGMRLRDIEQVLITGRRWPFLERPSAL